MLHLPLAGLAAHESRTATTPIGPLAHSILNLTRDPLSVASWVPLKGSLQGSLNGSFTGEQQNKLLSILPSRYSGANRRTSLKNADGVPSAIHPLEAS